MGEVITIGLDIAKSVFQIHGVDADGAVVSRVERGLAGVLEVTGSDNPNVFKDHDPAKSAQSMSH